MSRLTGITRRELLARLSAGVSGCALAGLMWACSPAGGAATAGGRVAESVTPRRGGTLRYALIGDYGTLDGQTVALQAVDNLWSVWDRLTFYDKDMQAQPMLAESWEVSSDFTQIEFKLRRGVQFHTGRELTADDVKWSLLRLQDPTIGSTLTGRAQAMVGVDAPDKYTVVVKASRPWAEAFDFFEYVNIVDPITFQAVGVTRPTGTGPFVLSEYVPGDHLRLIRNKNYWRNDRPYLDEVLVSMTRDGQAAVLQLEAGAVDLVGFGLPIAAAVRLQNDPKYQVLVDASTGAFWALVPNATVAPTNNRLVRQALSYAIDRKRIADLVWHGLAKPEALPWSPTSPAYNPAKAAAFTFDLDKARSLLEGSGVSNIHLDLVWSTTTNDFATVAQIYQADLAKIGVDLALMPLESAAFGKVVQSRTYQGLLISAGLNGHLRPASQVQGPFYGPEINYAGFKDDAYTQLASQVLAEIDPARQRVLYEQLNDYVLDQSWVMPVTQNPPHLVARSAVRGLRYDAHEALVLSDVWLA
ncbi:MAG TPA: ABC transporter substrate-binding protein [Chloroflexota bacterium]|nr:ABC transporter substrate-binding protein [Chloroflexota bacterium]